MCSLLYTTHCISCPFCHRIYQHNVQPLSLIRSIPQAELYSGVKVRDTEEAMAPSSPLHVLQQMELTPGADNSRHCSSGRPRWKLSVRYLLERIKQWPEDCTGYFFNPCNSASVSLSFTLTQAVWTSHWVFLLVCFFHGSRHDQKCNCR